MKISELSDEEVSRWIAEKIESMPHCNLADYWKEHNRPPLVWVVNLKAEWEPRDMVNDAQMTLMLLENMAGDGGFSMAGSSIGFSCASMKSDTVDSSIKIGRAVAESWMLANGFDNG